jgi:hypothetical protein
MSAQNNAIMLLIDNLRYDTFSAETEARAFFPNFMRLIDEGFVSRIVSNGHATKFAMAPIFSQTYPLDHGGYNYVMRFRPRSFVEQLQQAGYRTHMFQADDNDGPVSACERGFDRVEAIYDSRILLQNFIDEVLVYECELWQAGERSDDEIRKLLQEDFAAVLTHIANSKYRVSRRGLPAWVGRTRPAWERRLRQEIALLESEPLTIARKILAVDSHFYYLCFGRTAPDGIRLQLNRAIYRIVGAVHGRLSIRRFLPLRLMTGHSVPVAGELLKGAHEVIRTEGEPWFIYAHIMDVHDRRLVHRPVDLARRFIWLFRWLRHRRGYRTFERFLYDSALAKVDRELGRLLASVEAAGQRERTLFMISADHGCELEDARKRGRNEEFGWRAHPEHIEVPLICSPTDREPANTGLYDSMAMSATLLDMLEVPTDKSFKGRSALGQGRRVVVSENAGRGNADIARRDIYFTVTGETHKAMARLEENTLTFHRLYDCRTDPDELQNILHRPNTEATLGALVNGLFEERSALLAGRGVDRETVLLKPSAETLPGTPEQKAAE